FQEVMLPVLNQKGVEVDEAKIKKKTLPHLQKRSQIWYRGREGASRDSRIYHIELLDPTRLEMSGVSVFEVGPDFVMRRRLDGRGMGWNELDQAWEIHDGTVRSFQRGQADRTEPFKLLTLKLPERFEDFAQVPKAPDVMNYMELQAYIHRLQEGGHQVG